jgi:hypothetical protein
MTGSSTAPLDNSETFQLSDFWSKLNSVILSNIQNPFAEKDDLSLSPYDTINDNKPSSYVAPTEQALRRKAMRTLKTASQNVTSKPQLSAFSNQVSGAHAALDHRVRKFLSLDEDWDGDGARAIPEKAVYKCLNFLNDVKNWQSKSPNSVAPSPDGEILLYWHGPMGYAEANFDSSEEPYLYWSSDRHSADKAVLGDDDVENHNNEDVESLRRFIQEYL